MGIRSEGLEEAGSFLETATDALSDALSAIVHDAGVPADRAAEIERSMSPEITSPSDLENLICDLQEEYPDEPDSPEE